MRAAQEALVSSFIAQIEAGTPSWIRPWSVSGRSSMPRNLFSGRAYRGANVLQLWASQCAHGFENAEWATFKQALAAGAAVRKGERGTPIWFVHHDQPESADDPDARATPIMKQFTVFNRVQIDGLRDREETPLYDHEPIDRIEELLRTLGAQVHFEGDEAFYDRRSDSITMPRRERFDTEASFYGTLLHEHTHWTGAAHRLNREFGKRFGDEAYAFEELVAELGSAFACAELGVTGRLQHAEYLAGYAKALRGRPNALWTAASQASLAADYLLGAHAAAAA